MAWVQVQSKDYKWAACKSLCEWACVQREEPRCGCINSEVGAVRSRWRYSWISCQVVCGYMPTSQVFWSQTDGSARNRGPVLWDFKYSGGIKGSCMMKMTTKNQGDQCQITEVELPGPESSKLQECVRIRSLCCLSQRDLCRSCFWLKDTQRYVSGGPT